MRIYHIYKGSNYPANTSSCAAVYSGISFYRKAIPVGNEAAMFAIEYAKCCAAFCGTCPISGFRKKGETELSGYGSIVSTIVLPLRFVGNENPAGAFAT